MKHILPLLLILSSPAFGDEEYGTLNPEELSLNANVQRALRGETTMSVCASGYLMTKSGRHDVAREVFEACAKAGFTGTMTWMSSDLPQRAPRAHAEASHGPVHVEPAANTDGAARAQASMGAGAMGALATTPG